MFCSILVKFVDQSSLMIFGASVDWLFDLASGLKKKARAMACASFLVQEFLR
jgi:hypothetical protein